MVGGAEAPSADRSSLVALGWCGMVPPPTGSISSDLMKPQSSHTKAAVRSSFWLWSSLREKKEFRRPPVCEVRSLSIEPTERTSSKIVGEQHRDQDNMHGPVALKLRDKSIASLPAPRCKKATGHGLDGSLCSLVIAGRPLLHCGHVLCVASSLHARVVLACSVHSERADKLSKK